jgi:hypothetical protein
MFPSCPASQFTAQARRTPPLEAKALSLRVIAEEMEHGEMQPATDSLQFFVTA